MQSIFLLSRKHLITLQKRCLHKKSKGFIASYQNFFKSQPKVPKDDDFNPKGHVIQVGDPLLRKVSSPIYPDDIVSPKMQSLISIMQSALNDYDCVGLSAIQIGMPVRLFVMQCKKSQLRAFSEEDIETKKIEEIPFSALFNPEVKIVNNTRVLARETCSSVIGFSAVVPRAKQIRVKGLDENGREVEFEASDWKSRIIQHEVDHLNGTLFTDVMDSKTLAFNYWREVNKTGGDFRLSFGKISNLKPKWFFIPFKVSQNI